MLEKFKEFEIKNPIKVYGGSVGLITSPPPQIRVRGTNSITTNTRP